MADSRQPVDPRRPDLEDSTNVVKEHSNLLETSAAQAREKRIAETGMEPISLWVFLASAIVLLVGGGVLGAGGKLFSYNPHPQDYTRPEFASDADTGPTIGPVRKLSPSAERASMRSAAVVMGRPAAVMAISFRPLPGPTG